MPRDFRSRRPLVTASSSNTSAASGGGHCAGCTAADQRDGRFGGTRNRRFGEVDHSLQDLLQVPVTVGQLLQLTQRTGQIKRIARQIRFNCRTNIRYVLSYFDLKKSVRVELI